MPRVRRALATALVAALGLTGAGCGHETRHDTKQAIEQLASISAEGALMAGDVARDRTKTTFVRVHGEELSSQAQHEAEKLNDAPVAADVKPKIGPAIDLASSIGGAIDDVRTSPQDRAAARKSEQDLLRFAEEARKLADSL